MNDPYTALGVARDASPKDVRLAYRKLAKKHHPDLNTGNPKPGERFKASLAANELLSDPDKRTAFNRGEIERTVTGTRAATLLSAILWHG